MWSEGISLSFSIYVKGENAKKIENDGFFVRDSLILMMNVG